LNPQVLTLSLRPAVQTGCNMWDECTTTSVKNKCTGNRSGTVRTSDILDMTAMVAAHGAAPKASEVPVTSLVSSLVKSHDCLQSSLPRSTRLSTYQEDPVQMLSDQGTYMCGAEETMELPVLQGSTALGMNDFTTLVIRHIPSQYSQCWLMWEIDAAGFGGLWDFLHLPMDSKNRGNRGFAFINFKLGSDAENFRRQFHGKYLRLVHPKGALDVKPANYQGLYDNVTRVADSVASKHRRRKQYVGPLLSVNQNQHDHPCPPTVMHPKAAAPVLCASMQPESVPAVGQFDVSTTVPHYNFPEDL